MNKDRLQLEKEILANLINYPTSIIEIKVSLPTQAFLDDYHKYIYEVCKKLDDEKKVITKGSVAIELNKTYKEISNWIDYLDEVLLEFSTVDHLKKLVIDLIELFRLEKVKRIFQNTQDKIDKGILKSDNIIFEIENEFLKLDSITKKTGFQHISKSLEYVKEIIKKRVENKGYDINNYSTGYEKLNELLHGFKSGQLIVVAGRPSVGKTTLALNFISKFIFEYSKENVIIISREVNAYQLVLKMLSSTVERSVKFIEKGEWLTDDKWNSLFTKVIHDYENSNIYFDDSYDSDINNLYARLKSFFKNKKIGLIVIDYLQLFEDKSNRGRTRENEVAKISRILKIMANEFNCPIIAISQLGRRSEIRKDKRPILSDLRESGAIEQDADIVILLYTEHIEEDDEELGEKIDSWVTTLDIAKNRNGPIGEIKLAFYKEVSKFIPFDEG